MSVVVPLQARLAARTMIATAGCAGLGAVVWGVGPYASPRGSLLCLLMLGAQLAGMLVLRRGWVRTACTIASGSLTALTIGSVSVFWGIDGHLSLVLVPSILVAGMLLGPWGAAASAAAAMAYVGAELAWGPAPWVKLEPASRLERAQDLGTAFALVGTLTALLVSHYRSYVTAVLEREGALARADAFRQALIRVAPTPMIVIDPGGAVQHANDAAVRLNSGEEPRGPLSELVERRQGADVLHTPDGPVPVALAVAELEAPEGSCSVVVLEDQRPRLETASRQAQALRAVEEASRAKSAFLATMSHELRTPLNAIIGYGEMLEEEAGEATVRDDLGRILCSGRHLLALIDDVLDMSRVEAGRLEVEPHEVAVDEVVDEVEVTSLPQAARQGLRLDLARVGLSLTTDRLRLRQILLNLLSNALKHAHSRVELGIEAHGGEVHFEVRDDGPGVPAELLPRLFEPFARGASAQNGTGLGLALSRQVARRLGGDVELVRAGPGAVFRLRLPLEAAVPAVA